MKVSARSWHMRLCRLMYKDYQPRNLCTHFWAVLFTPLALSLSTAMFIVVYPFALVADMVDKRTTLKGQPPADKHPGLVSSWLKAKKRRICPLIEVVED